MEPLTSIAGLCWQVSGGPGIQQRRDPGRMVRGLWVELSSLGVQDPKASLERIILNEFGGHRS